MSFQITKWWGNPKGWSLVSEITSSSSAADCDDSCAGNISPETSHLKGNSRFFHPVQLSVCVCMFVSVYEVWECFFFFISLWYKEEKKLIQFFSLLEVKANVKFKTKTAEASSIRQPQIRQVQKRSAMKRK